MSYPKGDHPAQAHGSGQRPSFDRPSLFAGLEDDDATDDTRRVRILSTLESTRQATRPGRTKGGRRTRKSKRSGWLQGTLWGVLGLGVLALMAGFVMVVQDSRPAVAHAAPQPASRQAKTDLPKLSTLPSAAAGPAVIETTAVNAAPVAPQATPPAALAAQPALAPEKLNTTLASSQASAQARTDKATSAATTTAVTKSASKPATNAIRNQDEDVALLEAMFAHTGRKAAPKPANPKK